MAVANSGLIIRVPGRLSWNGTPNGTCRGIRFQPHQKYRYIWNARAASFVDSVYAGEGPCVLSAIVRYQDADALGAVAPNVSGSGANLVWLFSAGAKIGGLGSGRAGTLLFTPKASLNHPAIKLYAALPEISEDAELRMSLAEEYGLGLRFVGTPGAGSNVYSSGLLANLP